MFNYEEMKNKIILADCMDIMKDIPDKWFELAIVDPPYGLKDWNARGTNKKLIAGINSKKTTKWDIAPDESYFKELFRVSKNQIIWGANYFLDFLHSTTATVIWDKNNIGMHFSNYELAWTSNIKESNRTFKLSSSQHNVEKIHPTQKPVALYRWLLQNYAKPGDKIIDTHSGSGSLACACHLEKFDFLAIEKDEDYYKSSVERLETLRSQGVLF